ncbi:MAG: DNA polymerase III subunit epsilon [Paracoccaceae bacterium]|jgi:DNA polymerase-3 subunit epsilon|nr:DNA polymerase III subunit epsilon [Paracoccaceae bacterium]MDG1675725.1 DNA polymerase III subunit epsilon [Paracoccaceae bacterium]MDG2249170.1 DNA polymerase III subunit epsilon [Paracoccaceae bacterium]|tara:strand:- start:1775 stop:2473 length:699 start_codon:yes stop_codon:yes gene_type:complete
MREIVLDTETTGLDPGTGDKIVEIGAVELWNHLPTGKTFHKYLNPERNMPEEAQAVHGLTEDFLRDKPLFSQIVDDFLRFIKDSKLIIHNASFDMKFINAELELAKKSKLSGDIAIDTLSIARKKFPGSPASLDALCRRFNIDNSARTLHGALLDSEILAEVYLELIGGRQPDFGLSDINTNDNKKLEENRQTTKRPEPLKKRLTEEEEKAHSVFVKKLGENSVWHKISLKN